MAGGSCLAADWSGSRPDGEPDSGTNQIWRPVAIAYTSSDDDADAYANCNSNACGQSDACVDNNPPALFNANGHSHAKANSNTAGKGSQAQVNS